jgi:hypothetical protein
MSSGKSIDSTLLIETEKFDLSLRVRISYFKKYQQDSNLSSTCDVVSLISKALYVYRSGFEPGFQQSLALIFENGQYLYNEIFKFISLYLG